MYNINSLQECTKVLPAATSTYTAPDQIVVDAWLNTRKNIKAIADALRSGNLITALISLLTGASKV